MYDKKAIGIAEARRVIETVLDEAGKNPDRPVAVAVVDDTGELIAFARMDRTPHFSLRVARMKAYTAAVMRVNTVDWLPALKEQGRSVADFGDPMLIGFQGGIKVTVDGRVVGGIGVSGRASAEDEELVRAGMKAAGLA